MSSSKEKKDPNDPSKDPPEDPSMDQTWFMINLIMHTESKKLEKIDWNRFANTMGLSKGAATKRFERLLKSYGLNRSFQPKSGGEAADGQVPSVLGPKTASPKKKSSKRKRSPPAEKDDANNAVNEVDEA